MTTPQMQTPSRFSAENAALLLIDHQVGTMQLIKNIDRELAAKQSIALAKMAKILRHAVRGCTSPARKIVPKVRFSRKSPRSYSKRPGVVNAWAYAISAMPCLPQGADLDHGRHYH